MHLYGFVIAVADEGTPQLEACLGFLRAAYKDAPVVVISDGVVSLEYAQTCKRHGVTYVEGSYLKRTECGGRWWRRTLTEGLKLQTKWIVKIDPDTRIWRPFAVEPAFDVAGTVDHPGMADENVLGGCQAIHAGAALRILESGLLTDVAMTNLRAFTLGRDTIYREWAAVAWHGTDMTMAWLCRNLGIAWGDWADVAIRYATAPMINHERQYAATHPHKLGLYPTFDNAPLHVITTCKSRLAHLKETLPRWLAEPDVTVTVVDYDCPEGTAAWVRDNYPTVNIVRVTNAPKFHLAKARNIGALHTAAGWWCFFDADWLCDPGWAQQVRDALQPRRYLLAKNLQWPEFGSVVVHSWDFQTAGGYDELIRGWGPEDGDFYTRLRHMGVRPGSFPRSVGASITHDDHARVANYDDADHRRNQRVLEHYHAAKTAWLLDHPDKLPDWTTRVDFFQTAFAAFKMPCPDLTPSSGIAVAYDPPQIL